MTTLTEGAYWKARHAIAAAERDELDAKWMIARAGERLRLAMVAAGLDPAKNYRWHDASHTVEPAEPDA